MDSLLTLQSGSLYGNSRHSYERVEMRKECTKDAVDYQRDISEDECNVRVNIGQFSFNTVNHFSQSRQTVNQVLSYYKQNYPSGSV